MYWAKKLVYMSNLKYGISPRFIEFSVTLKYAKSMGLFLKVLMSILKSYPVTCTSNQVFTIMHFTENLTILKAEVAERPVHGCRWKSIGACKCWLDWKCKFILMSFNMLGFFFTHTNMLLYNYI